MDSETAIQLLNEMALEETALSAEGMSIEKAMKEAQSLCRQSMQE